MRRGLRGTIDRFAGARRARRRLARADKVIE